MFRLHQVAVVWCGMAVSAPALSTEASAGEGSAETELPRPEPEPTRKEPMRVVVALSGPDAQIELLAVGLRDAMSRLNVALTLRTLPAGYIAKSLGAGKLPPPEPTPNTTLARLFVDVNGPRGTLLYVLDDQLKRVFVRRFPASSGPGELTAEQIVLVAASSVESLLAGQPIGIAQQDYAAPGPAPPCTLECPEPKATTLPTLAAAYAVSWLGPDVFAHGPALALGVKRPSWGVGARLHAQLPVLVGDDSTNPVSVRLTTVGFRQRGYLVLPLSEKLSLLPGLGVGVDFTHVSPRGTGQGAFAPEPSSWALDGQAQAFAAVSHAARGFSVAGRLGCDLTTSKVRYVLAPGSTDVFVPFRARPWLELELLTDAL